MSRRRLVWMAAGTIAAGLGLSACRRAEPPVGDGDQPYRVVCTTGMVGDLVRAVAGAHAAVTVLIGPGIDPHLYSPTRRDIAALQQADVIFYSGLMLEGKMIPALRRLAHSGRHVWALTDGLDRQLLLDSSAAPGHPDPHVWMDVRAWSRTVPTVVRALSEYDPAHAADYQAGGQRYQAELEQLDAYVRRVVASIPQPQRVLITAHDAFRYFGRAYGIEVHGIQGLSTESEAGLADINRLVDLIVDRRVRAVFVETSVADKSVRALIEGAAARGWGVRIGGDLYSDALGPAGTYEGTYIGMIDHNATTIARALGGDAPPGGMQGRLTATLRQPP